MRFDEKTFSYFSENELTKLVCLWLVWRIGEGAWAPWPRLL